ncbi:hypothetical protein V6N13_008781 [Hibiscus sabdariffa]
MRVLSWNVQGLGSQVKRKAIRSLLRKQRIEMSFLVETKLEVISKNVIKSIWWIDAFSYDFVPSLGSSVRIIVIWEQSKFELVDVCQDPNFLHVRGTWCLEGWKCDMVMYRASLERRRICGINCWLCLSRLPYPSAVVGILTQSCV